MQALPERVFGILANDTLLAIPFFTLMGAILERCGLAEDLLDGLGQLFGPVRGGLGYAVIVVGAILGAITGTVAASVIAMGLISLPVMMRYGYDMKFATGVIAASGTITQLIPPSLVLIVLADQLGRSVGDMYAGAWGPSLVQVLLFCLYVLGVSIVKPQWVPGIPPESRTMSGWPLVKKCLWGIVPSVVLIFLVLGTIFLGLATPTEGGAMGMVGAIVLAVLHRPEFSGAARSPRGSRSPRSRCLPCRGFVIWQSDWMPVALVAARGVLQRRAGAPFHRLLCRAGGPPLGSGDHPRAARPDRAGVAVDDAHHRDGDLHSDRLDHFHARVPRRGRRPLDRAPAAAACRAARSASWCSSTSSCSSSRSFSISSRSRSSSSRCSRRSPRKLGIDLIWFGVLLCVNMQTSFMHPPFGFALFYLRGIAPKEVKSSAIYWGAIPWVVLQLIMVGIVIAWPGLVTAFLDKPSNVDPSKPPRPTAGGGPRGGGERRKERGGEGGGGGGEGSELKKKHRGWKGWDRERVVMIAVIFEVTVAPGRTQDYLDLAAKLRPELEKFDGFISIERFTSLVNEGKILSLSFWRDEEAVARWRNVEEHRIAQARGRAGIFADYRLRIASVIRDYGMKDRAQAPADSRTVHKA